MGYKTRIEKRLTGTNKFLNAVRPKLVIIPTGFKNRFDFPPESVINRYKNHTEKIYRTDINGAIKILIDEEVISVSPEIGRPIVIY